MGILAVVLLVTLALHVLLTKSGLAEVRELADLLDLVGVLTGSAVDTAALLVINAETRFGEDASVLNHFVTFLG